MNLTGVIEINGKEYRFPKSWDEVTLEQFIELNKVLRNEDLPDSKKELNMVSILCDIDKNLLFNSSVRVVKLILGQFEYLTNFSEVLDNEVYEAFAFDGVDYELPEAIQNITFSQYSNIDYFITHALDEEIDVYEFAPQIISLLAVEEGKEYKFEDAEKNFEPFKKLPVKTAYGIVNFFLSREEHFKNLTTLYSIARQTLLSQTKQLDELIKDGNGNRFSGRFLRIGLKHIRNSLELL